MASNNNSDAATTAVKKDSRYDDEVDYIPRGVLKTQRRGWQGEEMELEHLQNDHNNNVKKSTFCAVDKQQFYNHQIGEGYQAKHVIRQPKQKQHEEQNVVLVHNNITTTARHSNASEQPQVVVDKAAEASSQTSKRKREKQQIDNERTSKLQTYVKSAGMRNFRREIEKILSS